MALISLREVANKSGVTYTPANTTYWYAEDQNTIRSALQLATYSINPLSLYISDTEIIDSAGNADLKTITLDDLTDEVKLTIQCPDISYTENLFELKNPSGEVMTSFSSKGNLSATEATFTNATITNNLTCDGFSTNNELNIGGNVININSRQVGDLGDTPKNLNLQSGGNTVSSFYFDVGYHQIVPQQFILRNSDWAGYLTMDLGIGDMYLGYPTGYGFEIWTSDDLYRAAYFDGTGNIIFDNAVGIGTAYDSGYSLTTLKGLKITNTGNYELYFTGSAAANIYQSASNQPMYINSNGGNIYLGPSHVNTTLTVKNTLVGINTTTPAYTLDVNGNIFLAHNNYIKSKNSGGTVANIAGVNTDSDLVLGEVTAYNRFHLIGGNASIETEGGYSTRVMTFGLNGEKARLTSDSKFGLYTNAPTTYLDVNGDKVRVRNSKTPSSATDTGNKGDICWDSDYIYVAVGDNQWKRAALNSW